MGQVWAMTLAAGVAVVAAGCPPKASSMQEVKAPAVILTPPGSSAVRVRVEIARTPAQRERGLMYRDHLDEHAGMIFLFDEDEDHVFWMKNTAIPLDMIYITADLVVTGVVGNAEPFSLGPRSCGQRSRYVLEVNGGFAVRHRIAPGTRVRLENVL